MNVVMTTLGGRPVKNRRAAAWIFDKVSCCRWVWLPSPEFGHLAPKLEVSRTFFDLPARPPTRKNHRWELSRLTNQPINPVTKTTTSNPPAPRITLSAQAGNWQADGVSNSFRGQTIVWTEPNPLTIHPLRLPPVAPGPPTQPAQPLTPSGISLPL